MITKLRQFSASVFGRTFLLSVVALGLAALIGVILDITRPQRQAGPLTIAQIAERLDDVARGTRPPPPQPGPGVFMEGPPPGGPNTGAPDRKSLAMPFVSINAPSAPMEYDTVLSARGRAELTQVLGELPNNVLLWASTPRGPPRPSGAASALLLDEFLAARRRADGQWWVLEIRDERPWLSFEQKVVALSLGAALLLLPLAWLVANTISRPIERFANAAHSMGRQRDAEPLPETGPLEIKEAAAAFNAMQARIQKLLAERTELVAAIAHDLQTPLSRLAFRLDSLPDDVRLRAQADIDEMRQMITAALDFFRDRGNVEPQRPLELRALVESVVDSHTDMGHAVTLAPGSRVTVRGVPIALRRALSNLIENAIKYGERARVKLQQNAQHCQIEIEDDGPGIPSHYLEKVFEPFFRVEGSRSRETGGIGMGLAAVRAAVLEHGGTIVLENRVPRGLVARVTLPIVTESVGA